jgi:pilus assembly protein CpaF
MFGRKNLDNPEPLATAPVVGAVSGIAPSTTPESAPDDSILEQNIPSSLQPNGDGQQNIDSPENPPLLENPQLLESAIIAETLGAIDSSKAIMHSVAVDSAASQYGSHENDASSGKVNNFDKLLSQSLYEAEEALESESDLQDQKRTQQTRDNIYGILMDQIDLATASKLPRDQLKQQIIELIGEIVMEQRLLINHYEQQKLANEIADDMLGYGPLEPILNDEAVNDIMINGPDQVYVERKGKLQLTDIKFRDNRHLMSIAQRMVNRVGRRVDDSSPICDARLEDGSRVNVIAPPLALRGTCISIRKFSKKKITLDVMRDQGNISPEMCTVMKIAAACRLNIIISGGTGSGKTTLLNALSRMIDQGERVVTIEDAAELQLQQPHVVPLETRPANLEGHGEINMRDLVKNALRMRPDRIILGEVRGAEALDMLQAMNTGHDGSMCTLHANNPREALTRLENMVSMASATLPQKAIRHQASSAVHMIIQISRMRDGKRRITHISEVTGMEGDIIVMQDLFRFEFEGEDNQGNLVGSFKSMGVRPSFLASAEYYGFDKALLEAMA